MPIALRYGFVTLLFLAACKESQPLPCHHVAYCAQYDVDRATVIFSECVGQAPDDEHDGRPHACMQTAIVLACTKTKIVGRRSTYLGYGAMKTLAKGRRYIHEECSLKEGPTD